jgi:carbon-monoxide dehydrogenase medium subunit
MIPAAFEYLRADTVDDALEALATFGDDAKLLAGGMSLLPLMKLRLAIPSMLVDVGRLRELSYVRDAGDHLAVGALTRHRDLETDPLVQRHCGVLAAVAAQVGDRQVRHRGTVGGSVAHGDPASDLPAVLLAVDAGLVVRRAGGRERVVTAGDFFRGFLETTVGPDELLTEIRLPKTGPDGFDYQKLNRRAQDWAIVGALAVRLPGGATAVSLVNMGATPLRARAVEAALLSGASAAEAAMVAAEGTEAPTDLNATSEFREHLSRVVVRRALERVA